MLLHLGNVSAKVSIGSDADREWLADYLSFRVKDRGRLVYRSLFNSFAGTFPAGLLSGVQKQARADGIRIDVVDQREPPCAVDQFALLDWLRDYQREALDVARSKPRGVFHHVTGGGKTEVIVALTELYPCKWLVITHRKDLLHQTADRFAVRTGELVGKLGDGIQRTGRITIAMFQTLSALAKKRSWSKFFQGIEGVIVDECHILGAASFYRVMRELPNAYFRYGFSGTPFARGDRKSVYTWGALGPILHQVRAPRLIAAGVLARPSVRVVPVTQLIQRTTWQTVYRKGIVESVVRNAAVCAVVDRAAKPCLLFVSQIDHGRALLKQLSSAGMSAEFVWGSHNTHQRRAAIRRLVHADTDVLISNVIFQEGVDIPELRSVVIASGGKSVIMVLQDVGRGMRKHAKDGSITKEEVEIYDFLDRGNRWLQQHSRDRLRAYAREKYPVVIESGGTPCIARKTKSAKKS